MGLILNPVAYRIGHLNSWSDSWFLISTEYTEFLHSSIFLKSFIYYILYKFYPTRFSSWLLSHTEILFCNNTMYIWLYVYEASNRYKMTKYIRRLKFGLFRSLRMKTFWLKKHLLDKNPIAISLLHFLMIFGSHIEKYDIIENFVFDTKLRNKLDRLRLRYGKNWLGMEEVYIFRLCMRLFSKSLNPYGLKFLSLIINSFFFLPLKNRSLNQKSLSGLRVLMFFFSYMHYLVKVGVWSYYKSNALAFNSKIIFVMLRRTVYWLFFRPFINQLSKFLEYLCSIFGVSSIFRVSILTNFSLNAAFIARYIITAIKNGFNYMDIVFPIRKTLSNFMAIKIFNPSVLKNVEKKKRFINRVCYSVQGRLAFIINFVLIVKYKLIEKSLHVVYNSFNNDKFLKQFTLNCFINSIKTNKLNIVYSKNKINLKTKFVFRRFYTIDNKTKFLKFFSNRLMLESIEADRRAKRKPLTTTQRVLYNEKRKITRLEKAFKEQNEKDNRIVFTYKTYIMWKHNRYFVFRKFLKKISNKKSLIFSRFYSSNKKKNNNKVIINNSSNYIFLRKLNNIKLFIFFVKFFKYVVYNYSKINYKLADIKYLLRVRSFFLKIARNYFLNNNFNKFFSDISYYYHILYSFLISFNLFINSLYVYDRPLYISYNRLSYISSLNKGKKVLKKKQNVKYFNNFLKKSRFYSISNVNNEKKKDPISILKALVDESNIKDKDKYKKEKDKRKFYRRYRRFRVYPNSSFLKSKFRKLGKKVPSTFFFNKYIVKKAANSHNLYEYVKLFLFETEGYINLLLNNVQINSFVINKSINIFRNNKFSIANLLCLFILNLYFITSLLYILDVKFLKTFKFLKNFRIWFKWCLNILSISKFKNVSKGLFFLFEDLIHYIKRSSNVLSKYLLYLSKYNTLSISIKQLHFFFVMKFIRFLDNSVIYPEDSVSLIRYFFHLIYSISLNFNKIHTFNNKLIKRLINFLDICWYYNVHYLKNLNNFNKWKKFFFNYKRFFSVSMVIFKLLFNNFVKFDEKSLTLIYTALKTFFPTRFRYKKNIGDDSKNIEDVYYPIFTVETVNKFLSKFEVYRPSSNWKLNKTNLRLFNINMLNFYKVNCFSLHLVSLNLINNIFPLKINHFFSYINDLFTTSNNYTLNVELLNDKLLSYSNKIVRIKARDNIKSFLYGFKFHFVGRFTRKQQSASMWFRQGFLPTSAMDAQIDYGMFTIPLRYSACTIKIWLYRGTYLPKRTVTIGKWQ